MSNRMKTAALVVLALAFIALFLFTELRGNIDYVLRSRGEKVTAMVLVGWAGAISTVLFQTITNNRILTPSIIGLDSVYMLIQTAVVFLFGSTTLTMMNDTVHFLLSAGGMIGFSVFLYSFLFRREGQTVYFILLVGMILGTFFQSVTSFMQYLIDPNEFSIIQDRMFASFNNMKTELLWPAGIVIVVAIWYTYRHLHELDVLSLGKDHAINLGVSYETVVRRMLMIIAVLVSVSTALVGPIMFFGLIVANVAYAFFQTYEHRYLLVGAALFGIIALVSGQFVVERVFTFSTTLSVIINMVGGVYFLYLLLKERKAW
ncbi:iron chelate uptake ABC transporter family permease subunit [Geobacillus thermodenitrificans]|uniref:iron chelate uptake ABC transporter family permease subunit n=1 Tax=Geobacillus thermodenitrificans TaxID=33940 RepID=UPI002E236089|nr:iron chelate uptake ABC transporter family permease subunit [Geobacillus thermodenitrificans]